MLGDWTKELKALVERPLCAKLWQVVVAAIVAMALLFIVGHARAADTFYATEGKDKVWLTTEPCADEEILRHVPPQARAKMYRGRGEIGGKPWRLCWVPIGGRVLMVFPDGEGGILPANALHKLSHS